MNFEIGNKDSEELEQLSPVAALRYNRIETAKFKEHNHHHIEKIPEDIK